MKGNVFSREQMTESVVLPEKAIVRADGSADANQEILDHYAAQGALPRPFAPFMGSAGKLSAGPSEEKSANRKSTASWISIPRSSFLAPSSRSSIASISSFASSRSGAAGDKRKIRQIFNPVLPDELVISLGEQLTGASPVLCSCVTRC
jgi:hypothetical protein